MDRSPQTCPGSLMSPEVVAEFADLLHARRSQIAPPFARGSKSSYDLWTILHEKEVGEIDGALARIRAGSYGECVDCRGPVQLLHLYLNPTSSHCLACKPKSRVTATA